MSRRAALRRHLTDPREREAGMSLAELIVYSILLSFIGLIAISLLVQVLRVNQDVQAVASTSNEAQVTFSQLESDLRSASQAVVGDSGNLLVIRTRAATAATDDVWVCVGYYFDPGTAILHRSVGETRTQAAVSAGGGSALAAVASTWLTSITDATRLGPADGSSGSTLPMFGPANLTNPAVRTTLDTGATVTLNLGAKTIGTRKPVELRKNITIRPQGGSAAGCAG